jgi:glycosyltransferase involved in cell wall biosynthesis
MKILFLTTEGSSFWSHRLTLARQAQRDGAEVVIMVPHSQFTSFLEREGFRVIPWDLSRRSLNPWREITSLLQVFRAYRTEQPDIVHHIALKPVLYGGIAARFTKNLPVVNTITGLGPVFINSGVRMNFLRLILVSLLKFAVNNKAARVICQNEADGQVLIKLGISSPEKIVLIPGFGVDLQRFIPSLEPEGAPVVLLPARMLREKGVHEFVEAATLLKNLGVPVRMVLLGSPDENNPGCIPQQQIESWARSGAVEWWGHSQDMPAAFSQSHIVCLPSYGEGLPKVLLEAAACSRPIITTRVSGCSTVVQSGVNGILVPARDPKAIADAVLSLLHDANLRNQMGAAGRAKVVDQFSDLDVSRRIIEVYLELLNFRSFPRESFPHPGAKEESAIYLNRL